MKKMISCILLVIMVSVFCILAGCTGEQEQIINNTLTVEACMKDAGVSKSVQGTNLVYYYKGPEELSLYYVNSWNSGVVSLKRYYVSAEKYNIEKTLYTNARCDDRNLTIQVGEYSRVEDMDAYWTQIENSSTYTIVK